MPPAEFRILAIDPGSTSTKFGLFSSDRPDRLWTERHGEAEMQPFRGRPVLEQTAFRLRLILDALDVAGFRLDGLAAVVGRGGKLRPLASGTYRVDDAMLDELRRAPRGEHASNLGAILAAEIARPLGIDAFIVDPISVNERTPEAMLSGSALIDRGGFCHALNSKAIARRFARERGTDYPGLRLIVAHLGGGISISAHEGGRMVDVTDAEQEGPFSAERSGGVPIVELIGLCFSGRYTESGAKRLFTRDGGIFSYLGTKDFREVERRAAAGDAKADLVIRGMIYQIAKEIGAMAAVLRGRVDAILLTGGIAHSERLVSELSVMIGWIAPISLYPGEEELQALADGALRVLSGKEAPRTFGGP
jgi:butyrate kinase